MSGGFQSSVSVQPAPAVAGDFASQNPRWTVDFGPGGAVAGPSGLYVARACWAVPPTDANGASAALNSFGTGPITGIIAREQQGLITTYLADATMVIPQGFQVTPYSNVDLWVKNDGATQALPGQKAYASFANGKFSFAATGNPTTGGSGSASTIAAETSSFAGSIAGNILTVTGAVTGTIYPGTAISGASVSSGTQIVGQINGTAGGDGTYYVSIPEQTVASTTISGSYGLLTVGGTVVAGFAVGTVISGAGVVAGTTITALGTGTGAAGTYIVNNNTAVSSEAISVAAVNVETKWIATSSALPGEVVKISAQPLG